MDDEQQGDEVTILEAARLFNVAERTIRRRLDQGKLRGRLVGHRWLITLPNKPDSEASQALVAVREELIVWRKERRAEFERLEKLTRRWEEIVREIVEESTLLRAAIKQGAARSGS